MYEDLLEQYGFTGNTYIEDDLKDYSDRESAEEYLKGAREFYDQYDAEEAKKKKPEKPLSPVGAELQQKLTSYTDAIEQNAEARIESLPPALQPEDHEVYLSIENIRGAGEALKKKIPEFVSLVEEAIETDDPVKAIGNALQAFGRTPVGAPAMAIIGEGLQVLGEDDPMWRRRYEQVTGQKYYTKKDMEGLPPEEADKIRARQGHVGNKIMNSLSNIAQGFMGIIDNSTQNITAYKGQTGLESLKKKASEDPTELAKDVALSALDARIALSPIGMIGLAPDFLFDSADLIRTDPLAWNAVFTAGASTPGQIAAAKRGFKEGGIKGARAARKAKKLEQQEARKSIADGFEKVFSHLSGKENSTLSLIGRTGLDLQRGGGPNALMRGVSTVTSTTLPFVFSKSSLAGLPKQVKNLFKQEDQNVRANRNRLRDAVIQLVKDGRSDVFAVVREFAQSNQEIMPETYRVVAEAAEIMKRYKARSVGLQKQLAKENLSLAQTEKLMTKLENNNQMASQFISAIDNLDYAKIDQARVRELGPSFKGRAKNFKFDRLKDRNYWESAAQNAIRQTPDSVLNITYEGKPVHPLTFMLSTRGARNFDPTKLGVKVNTNKNISPEALEYLVGYQSDAASLIRLAAQQAMELANNLVDENGKRVVNRDTMILNSLAGYFPEGRSLKAFDAPKKGTSALGAENAFDIANQHLKLAREKRLKSDDVKSIEDAIEFVKQDNDAFMKMNEYLTANFKVIENAKLTNQLYNNLVESGNIFAEKPAKGGFVKVGEGLSQISPLEFGRLKNKYIPRHMYENLKRFDRDAQNMWRYMQETQRAFKTSKTTLSMPFYTNTLGGLSLGQVLYGGTPTSVVSGIKSYLNKDKFYRRMRDMGQIMSSDDILGIEGSANRSMLRRVYNYVGRSLTEKKDGEFTGGWKGLKEFTERLSDNFDNPKLARKYAAGSTIAGMLGGSLLFAGLGGGVHGALLGAGSGLLLARGRTFAGLGDQGSRVASFKRRITEFGREIAAREKIPLSQAIDIALNDPVLSERAARFALHTNLDYSYVPMGVERVSSIPGPFPFIKFAYRSAEAAMAYSSFESARAAAMSDTYRSYINSLPEEDKMWLSTLPTTVQGLVVRGGENFINLAFSYPLPPGSVPEVMLPATIAFGGRNLPYQEEELFEKEGDIQQSAMKSGWPAAVFALFDETDRYGRPIEKDALSRVKAAFDAVAPSGFHYNARLKSATENVYGVDFRGMNADQILLTAIGIKATPKQQASKYFMDSVKRAVQKFEFKLQRDAEKEIAKLKDVKEDIRIEKIQKIEDKLEKDLINLYDALFRMKPGASLKTYIRIMGDSIEN